LEKFLPHRRVPEWEVVAWKLKTSLPAPPAAGFADQRHRRHRWQINGYPGGQRPQTPLWPLWLFLGVSLIGHLNNRIASFRRHGNQEWPLHSYYSGKPRLLAPLRSLMPALGELHCKRWIEPLLSLGAGVAIGMINAPLGMYLSVAALMLAWTVESRIRAEREMVLDATDGHLDMLTLRTNMAEHYGGFQAPQARLHVSATVQTLGRKPPPPSPRGGLPAPLPEMRQGEEPAVPESMCAGLNEELVSLLREKPQE
jgi:hypothetical protein